MLVALFFREPLCEDSSSRNDARSPRRGARGSSRVKFVEATAVFEDCECDASATTVLDFQADLELTATQREPRAACSLLARLGSRACAAAPAARDCDQLLSQFEAQRLSQ